MYIKCTRIFNSALGQTDYTLLKGFGGAVEDESVFSCTKAHKEVAPAQRIVMLTT